MNTTNLSQQNLYARENYDIRSLDDEIRADNLCDQLLKECYLDLVNQQELCAEEASRLCYGVNYFLREYIIPDRRVNLFDITPQLVRQFGGNWYIIKNMEPNLTELTDILDGILAFHDFCRTRNLCSDAQDAEMRVTCSDLSYYQGRIDSFHAIENDGYFAWNAACPLSD